MDPIEELVALEAIKKVKHQYAHNLDGKPLDELVATAGINNRRLER